MKGVSKGIKHDTRRNDKNASAKWFNNRNDSRKYVILLFSTSSVVILT